VTENTVQSLKKLKNDFETNISRAASQHLGISIGEIGDLVPWEHRDVIEIRHLVTSIMELVHDQINDTGKTNERNGNAATPIHLAIHAGMEDCTAVLLARGADPDYQSHQFFKICYPEFEALFDLHKLLKYQEISCDRKEGMEECSLTTWQTVTYDRITRTNRSFRELSVVDLALNSQLSFMLWRKAPIGDGDLLCLRVPLLSVSSSRTPSLEPPVVSSTRSAKSTIGTTAGLYKVKVLSKQ
jgi:ankyrin repeat protein